jgi:hypothetical protein
MIGHFLLSHGGSSVQVFAAAIVIRIFPMGKWCVGMRHILVKWGIGIIGFYRHLSAFIGFYGHFQGSFRAGQGHFKTKYQYGTNKKLCKGICSNF